MLLTKRFGEAPEAAAGAAYERTFGASGKSAVAAFGHPYEVDPTTLDGNTGIFTLGASYAPASAEGLRLDFTGEAFAGDRRGVAGTLSARFAF